MIDSYQSGRIPLRRGLADSHVGAVAIASLLLISMECAAYALGDPLYRIGSFVIETIAILDIPYFSGRLDYLDVMMLINSLGYLYFALACGLSAILLSHWIYGVGPFNCLRRYRVLISRSRNVEKT